MALVVRGHGSGFFLTVTVVDTANKSSTVRYELRSADYATAVIDAGAIVTALSGVCQGVIASTSLSFIQDEDTFAYPANANVNVRARCTFQLANSVKKATLDIPAPKDTIFNSTIGDNLNTVDILDPEVITYAQLFQAGGKAFISDGETSDFIIRGKRVTR